VDGGFFREKSFEFHTLPAGTIRVKAAWIDMQWHRTSDRFHTGTPGFSIQRLAVREENRGWSALHIVAKTPTHPQAIWSTFEHVDMYVAAGDALHIRPGVRQSMRHQIRLRLDRQVPDAGPYNVER